MWRHHPQTSLGELLADGAIGRLRIVRATFWFPLDRDGRRRCDASWRAAR